MLPEELSLIGGTSLSSVFYLSGITSGYPYLSGVLTLFRREILTDSRRDYEIIFCHIAIGIARTNFFSSYWMRAVYM